MPGNLPKKEAKKKVEYEKSWSQKKDNKSKDKSNNSSQGIVEKPREDMLKKSQEREKSAKRDLSKKSKEDKASRDPKKPEYEKAWKKNDYKRPE